MVLRWLVEVIIKHSRLSWATGCFMFVVELKYISLGNSLVMCRLNRGPRQVVR